MNRIVAFFKRCMKNNLFFSAFLTWIFGLIWIFLEYLIEGSISDNVVENIMLVVFFVFVYGVQVFCKRSCR